MNITKLLGIEEKFNIAEKEYIESFAKYEEWRKVLRNAEREYLHDFIEKEKK